MTERNPNLSSTERNFNVAERKSPESRIWSAAVKKKDGYACMKCGSDKKLRSHHINNFRDFPELRFDVNNGVCLCEHCHDKFHKKYGGRNTTEIQLNDYLKRNKHHD